MDIGHEGRWYPNLHVNQAQMLGGLPGLKQSALSFHIILHLLVGGWSTVCHGQSCLKFPYLLGPASNGKRDASVTHHFHHLNCSSSSGLLLAISRHPPQALGSNRPSHPPRSTQISAQNLWQQSPDPHSFLRRPSHLQVGRSTRYLRCLSHLQTLVNEFWLRLVLKDRSCCGQRIHRSRCLFGCQTSLVHIFQSHLHQSVYSTTSIMSL